MNQEQKEYFLSTFKKLIDAYDSTTNKYASIAAILRVLADTQSEYIYTAEGYENSKIAAVETTDLYHIAAIMEELSNEIH